MKRKKIIAITSILTFSLNIFTPNVFAQEKVVVPNTITQSDNNSADSENKDKQEISENKEAKNEIKDDKAENSIDNNVEKETSKDNSKQDVDTTNNSKNEIKEDNYNKKEVNNNVENTTTPKNTDNKIENKKEDTTNKNNISVNTYDNKIKDENTKAATGQIADIPDTNLKAALNREIGGNRQPQQDIYVSELEALTGELKLGGSKISNLKGLEYCTGITSLVLTSNSISNLDPIKNLTELDALYLNGTKITDIEPLKNLTKLTALTLDRNEISNIEPLKGLTKLTYLTLFDNKVTDIEPLKNLTKLTELNLNNNQISNIEPLSGLTQLTKLALNNNRVSNIEPLRGLTQLTTLQLMENAISNIEPLSAIEGNLENLVLMNQTIDGGDLPAKGNEAPVENIAQNIFGEYINIPRGNGYKYDSNTITITFTNVKPPEKRSYNFRDTEVHYGGWRKAVFNGTVSYNIIDNNKQLAYIPDANLKAALNRIIGGNRQPQQDIYVSELEALTGNLYLNNENIRDLTGLEHCTGVKTIDLKNNQISNIDPLKGLTQLTNLYLSSNQISNIEPLKGLTQLTRLDLSNNQINNIEPLKGLTQLTNLSLNNNQISNIEPLKGLIQLTNLSLNNNQISNIEPLKGLTQLTDLYLSSNQISNIDPLKGLTQLTNLNLSNNQISNIEPLKGLTQLTNLTLSSNQISNIKPLSGLTKLIDIDLSNNQIIDLSQIMEFPKNGHARILTMYNQKSTLGNTVVDDGNVEIPNPVTFPVPLADGYYYEPNINITPGGSLSYVKESNKLNLSNLSDSINSFNIHEEIDFGWQQFEIRYSGDITLPVEHVSMIKVDLPTSMTFNVVTNTVNPVTNHLEPTFVTSDYTIKNRGKNPVTITPSYSVTSQGGVDLVDSIDANDIAKDNNVKLAVKLKNLSTNKDIMSVVNNSTGTPFTVGEKSDTNLRFEPVTNGMADVAKEQLSDTKTTTGKITFTISK
ncbi:hypothetical protein GNF80_17655 [Clostridium perfringens]|nr:hypothetical protein [Clostridium perfringens]